jgi:hypothetical protein
MPVRVDILLVERIELERRRRRRDAERDVALEQGRPFGDNHAILTGHDGRGDSECGDQDDWRDCGRSHGGAPVVLNRVDARPLTPSNRLWPNKFEQWRSAWGQILYFNMVCMLKYKI